MSGQKYSTVLFDLDGTLTDSGIGILRSIRYALTRMERAVPPEETLRLFIGPPLAVSFARYCGMSEADAAEAVRLYREYYSVTGIFENEVYGGVREMLSALAAGGARLVLATSKPEHFARRIMEHFDLARYFSYIGGTLTDGTRNDKADVIRYVLDTTGESPARCVMIGDRCYDATGAAQFGIPTIGVLWGYGAREELTEAGVIALAETPAQITEMILHDSI